MTKERTNVLGVGVSAVDIPATLDVLRTWRSKGESHYVTVTGVHGVMESQRDPKLRRIHNEAGLVVPDGMPLVWLHWLHGRRQADRVYGPDLFLSACEASGEEGWRHFFYGGADGVAPLLEQRMVERFPGLQVVGTWTPPFRPLTDDEDREVCTRILDSGADFVWIGLSTPKQERFMAEHVDKLPGTVQIGVGAAFDFHAGLKPQAPHRIQRAGLEWLFRLATEPRRLTGRYLRNNPAFLWHLALQLTGLKRYPLE